MNGVNSVSRLMNETMNNYKTNLKLHDKSKEDLGLKDVDGPAELYKTSTKSLGLKSLVQNNNNSENRLYKVQGKVLQANVNSDTRLPKINVSFKAYELG